MKQEMYYGAIVGHKRQGIGVGCKHTASVPKEEQFIVEGRHEGIITKEDFLKAQEIFCEIGEMKNVIPKTYPLYRKVKRHILVMELATGILPVHMQKSRQAKMDAASGML